MGIFIIHESNSKVRLKLVCLKIRNSMQEPVSLKDAPYDKT